MEALNRLHATLDRIVQALQRAEVAFHCTGGIVSALYGEPRLTQDIDVVIRLSGRADLLRLLSVLNLGFFVDEQAAYQAWQQQRMFQALDRETYIKIDFHLGEAVPGELDRTVQAEVLPGMRVPVVSREDAILSKLLWIRKGSHKSRQDVDGMLRRASLLEWSYLISSAQALGVDDLLQSFLDLPQQEP